MCVHVCVCMMCVHVCVCMMCVHVCVCMMCVHVCLCLCMWCVQLACACMGVCGIVDVWGWDVQMCGCSVSADVRNSTKP